MKKNSIEERISEIFFKKFNKPSNLNEKIISNYLEKIIDLSKKKYEGIDVSNEVNTISNSFIKQIEKP